MRPLAHALDDALARATQEPAWLTEACGLPPAVLAPLLPFYLPLARMLAGRAREKSAPLTVGIQGPQGAGKTTLCKLLQCVLGEAGLRVATLSIDDLYLTRAERAA